MGRTGTGKSTLGNLLIGEPHDNGPFDTSAQMDSATQECSTATMFINRVPYNIVDTPGIFDTREGTVPVLNKIAKTINKCEHGVKAILIVLDAGRFTEEQKNVLNEIRTFLGKDATNNIISVFSRATKRQTIDRNVMRGDWNHFVDSFIQGIGNRWGISPNPDIFSPHEKTHKVRLSEIKELISSIQGVYTTEQLEKNRKKQAEERQRKEEFEKEVKREYEEKLKEDVRREQWRREEKFMKVMEKMKQEQEKQKRREEKLMRQMEKMKEEQEEQRKQEREEYRREIESMRQERAMNKMLESLTLFANQTAHLFCDH
ncbi:hypothetical protein RclHR1_05250005 [Rhizophagus clarus]|nr:hypothetical protein RclHR1_05250005 [Rhizophagus clarus]